MIHITTVKFHPAGRQYDFKAPNTELLPGAQVIVETDRGRAMATVVVPPRAVEEDAAPEGLKSILRVATEDDLAMAATNRAREVDAFQYCQRRIHERQMEMKLVRAEYAFDGSKIIFYFTADGRVDFRELVKDLAHYFHTRIEMRQIGVRDEAKLVGGIGICGRELCCCTFLTEFSPVSVKMAKEQGLALNPNKISGQCGRLLCCLSYEFETYRKLKKGMPKCGKKVVWQNQEWEVSAHHILRRQLTLRSADGSSRTISMEEYESGEADRSSATGGAQPGEPTERSAGTARGGPRGRDRAPQKQRSGKADSQPDAPPPGTGQSPGGEPAKSSQTGDESKPKRPRRRRRRRSRGGSRPNQPKQGE